MNQSYRTSHLAKGADYENHFETYSFRRMTWRWERRVLEEIVKAHPLPEGRGAYLDFACGTARILSHLENHFETSVGVDVSPAMLSVAMQRVRKSQLILRDITTEAELEPRQFDFVTAFRFFANAEPLLREQAIARIASVTRSGGYFVFNNHRNCGSLTFRLLRLRARLRGIEPTHCMYGEEVLSLCRKSGFRLVKTYSWGVIPGHENKMFMPEWIQYPLERLFSSLRVLGRFATYELFVCEKL